MSLRHGLLGLLAEGPASGYDLARRFEEHLGPVWPAQHPKVYAELSRLADAGMIEIDSHGPRSRKAYRITDAGLTEVRRWLTEEEVDHTLRSESILRSFFFWLMEPDNLQAHLRRAQQFFAEIAEWRAVRPPPLPERTGGAPPSGTGGSSGGVSDQRDDSPAVLGLDEPERLDARIGWLGRETAARRLTRPLPAKPSRGLATPWASCRILGAAPAYEPRCTRTARCAGERRASWSRTSTATWSSVLVGWSGRSMGTANVSRWAARTASRTAIERTQPCSACGSFRDRRFRNTAINVSCAASGPLANAIGPQIRPT